uniref:Complex I assembly factor TIMMDC1, mitochondrial n=1 Tax=Calidris pygmaea TaxID=425635 RepID=A0A8C3KL70_9CHAR
FPGPAPAPQCLCGAAAPAAAGRAMAEGIGAPAQLGRPAPPPQTGWERLSELWRRDERQRYPEETVNIIKSAFAGGVVGWVYGGLPAFHQARRAFIEGSQGDLFQNRADAVQSAHRAGLRSFLRYGWRWMGLWFLGVFFSAFTGALFRMHLGLQGLAGGFVFGTAFGIPAGGLLMLMQKLAGETLQEKRNRERRELYERKSAEWQSRLSVTEVLGQMESDAREGLETEGARESRSY